MRTLLVVIALCLGAVVADAAGPGLLPAARGGFGAPAPAAGAETDPLSLHLAGGAQTVAGAATLDVQGDSLLVTGASSATHYVGIYSPTTASEVALEAQMTESGGAYVDAIAFGKGHAGTSMGFARAGMASMDFNPAVGSVALFRTISNAPMHFGTHDLPALTIDASQQVGIGTTTPDGPLDVYRNTNGGNYMEVRNPNGGGAARAFLRAHNGTHGMDVGILGAAFSGELGGTSITGDDAYVLGNGSPLVLESVAGGGGASSRIRFAVNTSTMLTIDLTSIAMSEAVTMSSTLGVGGALTVNGNTTLGNATSDTTTVNGQLISAAGNAIGASIDNTATTTGHAVLQLNTGAMDPGGELLDVKRNSATVGAIIVDDANGSGVYGTRTATSVVDLDDGHNGHVGTAPFAFPTCSSSHRGELRYFEDTDTVEVTPHLCACVRDLAALAYHWQSMLSGYSCP